MATASVTNTFIASTPAVAPEVNTNFTDLVTFLNNSVVHVDGSKAMTANFDAGSNKIVNLTAGVASTDAANVANVVNAVPVGVISMYGGSTAPSLHLICDGTAVSRVTYSALFAVIGTAFGAGDGSTTFNLPDLQDRYAIGDSGTLTLGGTVGSNDAVVVSHTHADTLAAPAHTHTFTSGTESATHYHAAVNSPQSLLFREVGTGGSAISTVAGSDTLTWAAANGQASGNDVGDHTHSGTTGGASATALTGSVTAEGVSGTNANRPASVVVNYIIKTGV